MAMIKPINKSVVHKICAGQVILDLSSAIKELIENSLDAGATSIEISLKDYGEDWFQVIDNGCGISPANFKVLALKHHTSKLAEFPDLQSLTTFGFRGEALSSLCALGSLTVETRTKNESVASHLTFDNSGQLIAESKTARKVGTTVTVKKLFSSLPVRSKEFSRNIRKEYGKLISLLNAYAIIAKGVRLVCTNMSGKNSRSVVLKTQGSGSIKDNIITLFGMNTFSCLEPVSIPMSENCKVEGFVSKSDHGSGRNMGDRQFFYVNGRPVDMPKVSKLVNELYRGANLRQYPVAILDFIVPVMAYDVNVTPDKRKIFFSDEKTLLQCLREALGKIYSASSITYNFMNVDLPDKKDDNSSSQPVGLKLAADLSSSIRVEEVCDASATARNDNHCSSFGLHIQKPRDKDFCLRAHSTNQAYSCTLANDNKITSASVDQKSLKQAESNAATDNSMTNRSSYVQSSLNKFVTLQKRKYENMTTPLSEAPILRNESIHCNSECYDVDLQCAPASLATNPHHDHIYVHQSPKHSKIDSDVGQTTISLLDDDNDELQCPRSTTKFHHVHDSARKYEHQPSKHYTIAGDMCQTSTSFLIDGDACGMDVSTEDIRPQEEKLSTIEVSLSSGKRQEKAESNLEDESRGAQPLQFTPPQSSTSKASSTLQFDIEYLVKRRKQMLSISRLICDDFSRKETKRCYTAATLELSQADNEEWKAKALAAATTELERLFRKRDFSRMKAYKEAAEALAKLEEAARLLREEEEAKKAEEERAKKAEEEREEQSKKAAEGWSQSSTGRHGTAASGKGKEKGAGTFDGLINFMSEQDMRLHDEVNQPIPEEGPYKPGRGDKGKEKVDTSSPAQSVQHSDGDDEGSDGEESLGPDEIPEELDAGLRAWEQVTFLDGNPEVVRSARHIIYWLAHASLQSTCSKGADLVKNLSVQVQRQNVQLVNMKKKCSDYDDLTRVVKEKDEQLEASTCEKAVLTRDLGEARREVERLTKERDEALAKLTTATESCSRLEGEKEEVQKKLDSTSESYDQAQKQLGDAEEKCKGLVGQLEQAKTQLEEAEEEKTELQELLVMAQKKFDAKREQIKKMKADHAVALDKALDEARPIIESEVRRCILHTIPNFDWNLVEEMRKKGMADVPHPKDDEWVSSHS